MIRNVVITGMASVIMAVFVLVQTFLASPPVQPSMFDPMLARASSPDAQGAAELRPTDGESSNPQASASSRSEARLVVFREQIRPLLVGTCLKCHDSEKRTGGLDLTRRATALAGGDSGEAIVPGKPMESMLYQLVTAGEMPRETNPLLPQKIAALKQWIELGAPYEGELLAPTNEASTSGAAGTGGVMMGQGMMGGQTNQSGITALPLLFPVTKDQAKERADHYLKSFGNPNLTTGKVNETIGSYEIQVVTTDNSLANWIVVDKTTGQVKILY